MVYFKEVLPNPTGLDTDGEWIKIINTGNEQKNLSGWSISDKSGKTFLFSSLIPDKRKISSQEELVLPHRITGISLNNNGDTLTIRSESGKIEDTLLYTGPVSDDEIVFGEMFVPETEANVSLSQNLANLGADSSTLMIAPILTAVFISVIFGVAVSFLTREVIFKNKEHEN